MATASRQSDLAVDDTPQSEGRYNAGAASLFALMQAEPWGFSFFQMVRLLEKLRPEQKAVGIFVSPADEVVRFHAVPTLNFPPSELGAFTPREASPSALDVNFLGLNVVNGPMPRGYTEALLERKRAKDSATLEFFDLFNHRAVSLFYRAWARYRFFITYERNGSEDEVTRKLYDLVGLGTLHLRGRMAFPDESAIYYSGLLGSQVRSAEGLKQILQDFFCVRVEVRQFTGTWVRLPPDQRTVLRGEQSRGERLGAGTVVGHEVWDQEGTMTVRIGPMPLARYHDFLPGGTAQRDLRDWLLFYSRRAFDFIVQLLLEREEVPPATLTTQSASRRRLGYDSWLKVSPMRRDPDETTYLIR